jgi:TRAP-type C4-dicarboxylate transport system permease small subunit
MYRKQMKFQRLVCFAMLAASALIFIYSLGLVTDLYDAFYSAMRDPNNIYNSKVEGAWIFYEIQPFNHALTAASIVLIICSIILFLTNTHSRRKYYVANYVATILNAVVSLGITVWGIINISSFRNQYLTTVDFAALKEYAEKWNTLYTDSTFWFDIGYVIFAIVVISVGLSIYNLIWKKGLMADEQRLIKEGLEA